MTNETDINCFFAEKYTQFTTLAVPGAEHPLVFLAMSPRTAFADFTRTRVFEVTFGVFYDLFHADGGPQKMNNASVVYANMYPCSSNVTNEHAFDVSFYRHGFQCRLFTEE